MENKQPELKNIPIEWLVPGKYQPRIYFDSQTLLKLAESMKSEGLLHPIIVRMKEKNLYEIIAGERRWRAAQLAKLSSVLCLVNNYTDKQAAAVAAVENIQRDNLNAIEEALAYQKLVEEFGYGHEEVGAIVGKSRVKITNLLRLLKLDQRVQQFIIEGKLEEVHGKIIAGVNLAKQYVIAQQCVANQWSTRKLEQEIHKKEESRLVIKKDLNIVTLERLISEQLGTEVKIEYRESQRSGWLKIKYFNNAILEGILEKLRVKM